MEQQLKVKPIKKNNWYVIVIGFATVILGAIAIITALRLYQAGNKPVAPNVPESKPEAQTLPTATPTPVNPCLLTFNLTVPTNTSTPTPTRNPSLTPTLTPTVTPTPTPLASCYHTCTDDNECEGNLICQTVAGSKKCVAPQCPGEADCICNKTCWEICGQNSECPTGTTCRSIDGTYRCVNSSCDREQDCTCGLTQKPTPTVTTAPEEALPEAGTDLPTLGLFAGGLILILIPLLLAF